MRKEQMDTFLSAVKAAEIETYELVTDIPSHLYNNGVNAVVKTDLDAEISYNFRPLNYGAQFATPHSGPIQVVAAAFEDIHEVRIGGNYEQIVKFVEEIGSISLTDDELKVLVHINSANREIKPITGNYNNFHYLSEKEYEALSEEEKAEYDKAKADYEEAKEKYIGEHSAAQITL